MRVFVWGLFLLFLVLQYALWFSPGGVLQIWHLHQAIGEISAENKQLMVRNALVAADVADLKKGQESIEEHARNDLGMIKSNETFYQITK